MARKGKKSKIKKKASRKVPQKNVGKSRPKGKGILSSKKAVKDKIHELVIRGIKLFDQGDYEKALPILKKVNELDGNMADILNMLGLIFHSKGKFNNALQAFEEALSINPNYTEASLNLAVTCNDLGRYKEAKFVYTRAKNISKPSEVLDPYVKGKIANMHAEIAEVYRTLGQYGEASNEFRKALELRPTFVDIQTKYGIALRENGQKSKSLDILKKVCKRDPKYLPAAINLGVTYYSMGKNREAVKVWKTVLKKDPQDDKAKMYLRLVGKV